MKQISYRFLYIDRCNFCEAKESDFKILGRRLNQSQGKNPRKKIGITTVIVQCKNCGLIFSNPQPNPNSIQDHYDISPADYWSKDIEKIEENYFKGEIDWLGKLIDFKSGIKILDIGAGTGKCMKVLEKHGYETFGLEPSKSFHETAVEKMKISPERIKLSSIEEAEYPNNFFDVIFFTAVLEHLYDPSCSIQKALLWLKPNGIIHIQVPSSDWLTHKLVSTYYRMIGTDYVGNLSPMHKPYHLYEFSLKSFQKHSKRFNYEIADYGYYVCETYLPRQIDFLIKPYMRWTNTGMQLAIWIRKK